MTPSFSRNPLTKKIRHTCECTLPHKNANKEKQERSIDSEFNGQQADRLTYQNIDDKIILFVLEYLLIRYLNMMSMLVTLSFSVRQLLE